MIKKLQIQFTGTYKFAKHLVLLVAFLGFGLVSKGQITISGGISTAGPFTTLNTPITGAIAALNNGTLTGGPVYVDIAPGYSEILTAPIILTKSGTAASPIIIRKTNIGTNPKITAYAGTNAAASGAATIDGIFILQGCDYVTIDGIDLVENASNTTAITQMEVGYGLFKNSVTDGCNNDTIRNCNITGLLRLSTVNGAGWTGSTGIESANSTWGAVSTTLIPTAISGTNSNNAYINNTITGGSCGIQNIGYNDPAITLCDQNNYYYNNTITDFGNAAGGTNSVHGIVFSFQNNFICSYNTIASSSTSKSTGHINGIYNSTAGGGGGTISYNNITLNGGGTTTQNLNCIRVQGGLTGYNINITNNKIQNSTYTTGTTGVFYGILSTSTASTVNINNDTILNNTYTGAVTTAQFYGINTQSTPTTINVNNNYISGNNFGTTVATLSTGNFLGIEHQSGIVTNYNCIGNTIINNTQGSATSTNSGNMAGIDIGNNTVATTGTSIAIPNVLIRDNTIDGLTRYGTTGGATWGIFPYITTANTTCYVKHNTIKNIVHNTNTGSGCTTYGIRASNSSDLQVDSNIVNTLTNNKTTGTSTLYGIYDGFSPTSEKYRYNSISNITSFGATPITGIYLNTGTGTREISYDTITNYTAVGAVTITGIQSTASTPTIKNNTISNLGSTGAGGSTAITYGLNLSSVSSGIAEIYNNMIFDIRANATTTSNLSAVGINLAFTSGAANVRFNTVYLNPSTPALTANASSCGVNIGSNTPTILLQNNIINNQYISSGTGVSSAVSRATVGTTPTRVGNVTFGNNIYYSKPGTNNFIYSEGTTFATVSNSYFTSGVTASTGKTSDPNFNTPCSLYKIWNQDLTSFTEDNLPLASSPNWTPSNPSYAQNSAVVVATIANDYSLAVRNTTTPDMGAIEFTGTGTDAVAPAITYTATAVLPNTTSICNPTFTVTITDASGVNTTAGTKPRVWYKKASNANVIAADNTNATDGWKYVEATNTTSPFSFTLDYSILNGGATNGDVINYFVVAQDIVTVTPNVGTSVATYSVGYCPTSVALGPTGFPVSAFNTYSLLALPTSVATSNTYTATQCTTGGAILGLNPTGGVLNGVTYQWQSSPTGANTYTNIAGATSATYTAVAVTASTDYRCIINGCSGSPIAASPSSVTTILINSPTVTSVTPGSRCGTGTVSLSATGTNLNWYAAATGGTSLGTSNTFVTPSISVTTPFYVTTSTIGSTTVVTVGTGSVVPSTTGGLTAFNNYDNAFKNQSVYLASELLAAGISAGNLTSIAYNITTLGSIATNNNLTIKIGTTAATTASTTFATGLSTVYGPTNYTHTASGWQTITFATPFYWDGVSNIVIEESGLAGNSSLSSGTNSTTLASNMSVYTPYTGNSSAAILAATTGTATTYRMNAQFGNTPLCEGPRKADTAYVNSAPILSANSSKNIKLCNKVPVPLSVASTITDFDTYVWSPVASLYSDAAGTIPYVANTNTITVYANPTVTTTYTLNAVNSISSCANVDTVKVSPVYVSNTASVTATVVNLCNSGTSSLSVSGIINIDSASSIQWQSSTDSLTWTDITGATSKTYTTPTITSTTYYRLNVNCSGTPIGSTAGVKVTVNNPSVTSTTPVTRCGTGTVVLNAIGSAGSVLNWYTNPTGGTTLSTGSSYTTASVASTYTYYVTASTNVPQSIGTGTLVTGSTSQPTAFMNRWTNYISQTLYTAAELIAAGNTAGNLTSITYNTTSLGDAATNANLVIKIGTTTLTATPTTFVTTGLSTVYGPSTYTHTSSGYQTINFATPYVWDGISNILVDVRMDGANSSNNSTTYYTVTAANSTTWSTTTGGSTTGTATTTRINTIFNYQPSCESPRVPVIVTINPPPAITASTTATICAGSTTPLNVTSSNDPNYTYTWMPGSLSGSTQNVTPATTTIYTVSAIDNTTGANSGCAISSTVTITVNPVPTPIVVSPNNYSICPGNTVTLSVTGGLSQQAIFTELANAAPTTFTITNTAGTGTATQNTTYFSEGNSSVLFNTASTSANVSYALNNNLNLQGADSVILTFAQIAALEGSITTYDKGYVEYSTDGGTTYTVFPTTSYQSTGTLVATGTVFSTLSYTDWISTFTSSAATPGAGPATSLWKNEKIKIPASALTSNQFRIRFRYTTDGSTNYYGWLLDNINITKYYKNRIWSPNLNLFTNAGATSAYSSGDSSLLYAKPTITTTYTVTSTIGSCSKTDTARVNIIPNPTFTLTNSSILCNGGTATIDTVKVLNAIKPYQFSLNAGAYVGTSAFTNNNIGTYTYTIKDANGCSASNTISVTQPSTLTLTATPTNFNCSNGSGSIALSATGGTGSTYTYTVNGVTSTTTYTTNTAGTYTIIASDINSCSTTTTVTLTAPSALTITATPTNALCKNDNGSIAFSATGGTGSTYSYLLNGVSASSGVSKAAGTYTLVASDANSCTISTTVSITEPSAVTITKSATGATCASNGSITFSGGGGSGTFTYTVNGNPATSPSSQPAGTYTIIATDINSCSISATQTVTQPSSIALSSSYTNAVCNSGNGTIVYSATGGAGSYTFTVNGTTSTSPSSKPAGIYTVQVLDAGGCNSSTIITISAPAVVAVSATPTNANCNGANGSLAFSATGGNNTYTFTVNGTTATSGIAKPAGAYTIIATDGNGCVGSTTTSITAPAVVAVTATPTNATCNGANGSLAFSATGGNNTYTFTVNGTTASSGVAKPAGAYTIIATDGNGCVGSTTTSITAPAVVAVTATPTNATCNGANGSLAFSATGGNNTYTFTVNGTTATSGVAKPAGAYTIIATDGNGCIGSTTTSITAPAVVAVSATPTNATCNGANGSLAFSATGGNNTYTFTVNGTTATTGVAKPAGAYTIIAIDGNGCVGSTTTSITAPAVVAVTATPTNATCFGGNGSLAFSATGGNNTYTFTVNGTTATTGVAKPAGAYTIIATDGNGCVGSTTTSITAPAVVAVTATPTNATCNGANGSLAFSATGGNNTYTFTVNGTTASSGVAKPAGAYTIIATDGNGCVGSIVKTITAPASSVTLTASATAATCGSNGSLTFNASGGTGSTYTYTVNSTQQTSPYSAPVGTYTVIASDVNSCMATSILSVTQPSSLALSSSNTNPLCNGGNGIITYSASGGSGTYTFTVNGASHPSPYTTSAGTYTIQAVDGNNCSLTSLINITAPAVVAVSATPTNATCNGANGSLAFSASGGNNTYTFTVNGTTATTGVAKPAGAYTIIATDGNGCVGSTTTSITAPAVVAVSATPTNATCNGANGNLAFSATGGNNTYTFTVNGTTASTGVAKPAGAYTIIATDGNGCVGSTTTSITAPAVVAVTATPTNATCNGANGSLAFSATGGNNTYTFTVNGTTATSGVAKPAGAYTIIATDGNGCVGSTTTSITAPAVVAVTATPTNATCYGANGSLAFSATGGNNTYTFTVNGTTATTGVSKPAGAYTIIATDGNGCVGSTSTSITAPAVVAVTATPTNATCNGANGSLAFSATGGNNTYTFTVNGTTASSGVAKPAGAYTIIATDGNGCVGSTTTSITAPAVVVVTATPTNATCNGANGSLAFSATGGNNTYTFTVNGTTASSGVSKPAGAYTIIATDGNGCVGSTTTSITAPAVVAVSATPTNAICNGANGSLAFSATGGNNTYTFTVNGTTASSGVAKPAGAYTIIATDGNGCVGSTTTSITAPAVVVVTATPTNATCNGANGSLAFSATGGNNTYTFTVNGTTASSGVSKPAGAYTIIATDGNGCVGSTTTSITAPAVVAVSATPTNATCNGANGSLAFSATGGNNTYTFTVNGTTASSGVAKPAGAYTIIVTDGNGCVGSTTTSITTPAVVAVSATPTNATCNGANGSLAFSATGGNNTYTFTVNGTTATSGVAKPAGAYTIIAIDGNGCVGSTTTSITAPAVVAVSATPTNATCNGANGSLAFSATGGNNTYTFTVNGTTASSGVAKPAGAYTIIATDGNGCVGSITTSITAPAVVAVSATPTNATCNGANGSLAFSATGGNNTYTFTVNGTTASSGVAKPAGAYTIIATDGNGCVGSITTSITAPAVVAVSATPTNATCNGANGSLAFSATGGNNTYTFTVNGTTATTGVAKPAGAYTIIATDGNGCVGSTTTSITAPAVVAVTATPTNATCNGANGSLAFSATGGNNTYTFTVNGTTASTGVAKPAGAYTIIATDGNGCVGSTTTSITAPAVVAVSSTPTNATCNGANGSLAFSATGGNNTYTFTVNGTTATSGVAKSAGAYTIIATDGNGCIGSTISSVAAPSALTLTATPTDATCNGANGSITFSATGGTGTISYKVNGASQTSPYTASANTYTVNATDGNSCSKETVVTVAAPSALTLTATPTDATCNGANGSIAFSATGGTGTIVYKVNGASQTSPYTASANTYTVNATDGNSCSKETIVIVSAPSALTLTTTPTDATCNGANGSIAFSATGGTGTIAYKVNGASQTSPYTASANTYTVNATDGNSCSKETVVTVAAPSALTLTATPTDATCNGANGSIAFSATGGTGTIVYKVNGTSQSSPYTSSANTYTINATDGNSCSKETVVTVTAPSALTLTATPTDATCNGANGSIAFSATGGTGTIVYKVNGASQTSPYTASANTYTVNATDGNSCSKETIVIVSAPSALTLTTTPTDATCNGANGSIAFSATGGTGTIAYKVNGASQTSPYTASANTYTVNATDGNSCSKETVVTVAAPSALTLTATPTDATCNGANGSIAFSATGGTGTIVYKVNGTSQSSPYTSSANTYTINATDGNSCSKETVVTVTAPSALTLTATPTDATCNGANGSITFSATGGTGTITYMVNGASQSSPYTASANTYTVNATDGNSCSKETVVTVSQPNSFTVTANVLTTAICKGSIDSIYGEGALSYTWSGGLTDRMSYSFTTNGTYTVIGTDANSCTSTSTVNITVSNSGILAQSTPTNTASVSGTSCTTLTQPDGSSVSYHNSNCDLIATVSDATGGNNLGAVTACVTVLSSVQTVNGQPYVPRVYDITPTHQGPANVTLYYTNDDFLDYNANAGGFPTFATLPTPSLVNGYTMTVCISKINSLGNVIVIPGSATWNAAEQHWEVQIAIPSFSTFYCHACNPNMAALDLTLTEFKGAKVGTTDILSWTTENEKDMKEYWVERSADGINFKTIGKVATKAINGTSASAINYSYTDETPMSGNNFYKLQMLDKANNAQTSKTIKLVWGNEASVVVYPNPATNDVNLDITSNKASHASIKIFDATGKVVRLIELELEKGNTTTKIDLADLASGAYLIKVSNDKGLNFSQQFNKQ